MEINKIIKIVNFKRPEPIVRISVKHMNDCDPNLKCKMKIKKPMMECTESLNSCRNDRRFHQRCFMSISNLSPILESFPYSHEGLKRFLDF